MLEDEKVVTKVRPIGAGRVPRRAASAAKSEQERRSIRRYFGSINQYAMGVRNGMECAVEFVRDSMKFGGEKGYCVEVF